jgi:hypothetical protein
MFHSIFLLLLLMQNDFLLEVAKKSRILVFEGLDKIANLN